jgi:hypothetical protein
MAKLTQNTALMYYINIALMPIFIALVTRKLTSENKVLTDASQIDLFNSRWYYKVGTVIMTTIFSETLLAAVLNVVEIQFLSSIFNRCRDRGCTCNARKTKFKIQ